MKYSFDPALMFSVLLHVSFPTMGSPVLCGPPLSQLRVNGAPRARLIPLLCSSLFTFLPMSTFPLVNGNTVGDRSTGVLLLELMILWTMFPLSDGCECCFLLDLVFPSESVSFSTPHFWLPPIGSVMIDECCVGSSQTFFNAHTAHQIGFNFGATLFVGSTTHLPKF